MVVAAQRSLMEVLARLITCRALTVRARLLVVGTEAHARMAVGIAHLPGLNNQVTSEQHQQPHVKGLHQGGRYSTMVQTNLEKPRFAEMDTPPVISLSAEI